MTKSKKTNSFFTPPLTFKLENTKTTTSSHGKIISTNSIMPSPLILDICSLCEASRNSKSKWTFQNLRVLVVEEIDIFVKSDSKVYNFVPFRIS